MYKCRYGVVVRSWDGVEKSRIQFQPTSTTRVRRQTLQNLCGSAFASGANTGQPGQELEGETRRVKYLSLSLYIYIYIYTSIHLYIYIYIYIYTCV